MSIHAHSLSCCAALAFATLLTACGGPFDDVIEDIVRGGGHTQPPHTPPEPAPGSATCVDAVPPPPQGEGDGACPPAGSDCPGGLPPLLLCRHQDQNVTMRCHGSAGWRLDMLVCPPELECVADLPPPPPAPGNGECPQAGSACPGTLPPLLLCRYGGVDAAMACDGTAGWRLDMLECRPVP